MFQCHTMFFYRSEQAFVLVAILTIAHAYCDGCFESRCHDRRILIEGYNITKIDIDHKNNIIYTQLESGAIMASYLDDLKVKMIMNINSTGIVVDQETGDLYITDDNQDVYKYIGNETKLTSKFVVDSQMNGLAFKNLLYWSPKSGGFCSISPFNNKQCYRDMVNFIVDDFVFQDWKTVYFIANNRTYKKTFGLGVYEVFRESYLLSVDSKEIVYFLDDLDKVIYVKNDLLTLYGNYDGGSVKDFVFNGKGEIVYLDSTDGNLYIFKKDENNVNNCSQIRTNDLNMMLENELSVVQIK